MKKHEQRVVDEKNELDVKIEKLSDFFNTPIFDSLEDEDKSLLENQHNAMESYSDLLKMRVARFKVL